MFTKVPFQNVLTESSNNNIFTASSYKKSSLYLTSIAIPPTKYKIVFIKENLIHRAFYISVSKTIFYKELSNTKQTVVNEKFPSRPTTESISSCHP